MTIKPMINYTKNNIYFSFSCNKLLTSESYLSMTNMSDNAMIIINIVKIKKSFDVYCYLNSKLKFVQTLPWIKNQKYIIRCSTKLDHVMISKNYILDDDNSDYSCVKCLSMKEAKSMFKAIKQSKLVGEAFFDNLMQYYDWKCLACNYGYVGNPDTGYVRYTNKYLSNTCFKYGKYLYEPVKESEYDRLSWYNKKQYLELLKQYEGNQFLTFEKLWKQKCSDNDILSDKASDCGAWRNKHYDKVVSKDTYQEYPKEQHKLFEKVVTLGWHNKKPENSVPCPVCKDLHKIICETGYQPLNIFQKLKLRRIYGRG